VYGNLLLHERTREQGDQWRAGTPILGVHGILNASQRAGMFYQNMLETASSADERYPLLAGRANRIDHGLRLAVRTAGSDDERRVVQVCVLAKLVSPNDVYLDIQRARTGGVLERSQCRRVVRVLLR
jgi:hypothetical protein